MAAVNKGNLGAQPGGKASSGIGSQVAAKATGMVADVAASQVAKPDPWPEGAHTFVQFAGVVVVHDSRGVEQLTDRAALGNPLGDHGLTVMSIVLDGDWFDITAMGRVLGSDVARTYRVPLTNVRSARR